MHPPRANIQCMEKNYDHLFSMNNNLHHARLWTKPLKLRLLTQMISQTNYIYKIRKSYLWRHNISSVKYGFVALCTFYCYSHSLRRKLKCGGKRVGPPIRHQLVWFACKQLALKLAHQNCLQWKIYGSSLLKAHILGRDQFSMLELEYCMYTYIVMLGAIYFLELSTYGRFDFLDEKLTIKYKKLSFAIYVNLK